MHECWLHSIHVELHDITDIFHWFLPNFQYIHDESSGGKVYR